MFQIRKSDERGLADHGWLRSRHTFSFADYHDPAHIAFRSLRVINEDRIDGGTGFGKHSHQSMEIISYVVEGSLQHQDSMGNKTIISPGEVQRLSAGTGIAHSEYNHDAKNETHFFQIWILPKKQGGTPGYGQKNFTGDFATRNLVLVVSETGRDGSIAINQDADVYIAKLKNADQINFSMQKQRGLWVQIIRGAIQVNQEKLSPGDAISFENEDSVCFQALEESEFLLFDLA